MTRGPFCTCGNEAPTPWGKQRKSGEMALASCNMYNMYNVIINTCYGMYASSVGVASLCAQHKSVAASDRSDLQYIHVSYQT